MLMKGILGTCISTLLLGKEIKMEFYLNLNQNFRVNVYYDFQLLIFINKTILKIVSVIGNLLV
jgi:hypothetical protein